MDAKYPLPNISHILNQLGKTKIFSCLDLKQGYLQIPLNEASMELPAFTGPEGHYEHNSMPLGLKMAPSCFQAIINNVLVSLVGQKAHVYLDDIIIMGTSFGDHVGNLTEVLNKVKAAKLMVKFEKCSFFRLSIDYLDHITPKGMRPQPQKLDALKTIPPPRTGHELQSFLGVTNYYC